MPAIVDLVPGGPAFAPNERAVLVIDGPVDGAASFSFFDLAEGAFIGPHGPTGERALHPAEPATLPDGRCGYAVGRTVTGGLRLNARYAVWSPSGLTGEVVSRVATFRGGTTPAVDPASPAQPAAAVPEPATPAEPIAPVQPLPLPRLPQASPPAGLPPAGLPPAALPSPLPLPPLQRLPGGPAPPIAPVGPLPPPPRPSRWGRLILLALALLGAAWAFLAVGPADARIAVCRHLPDVGPCQGAGTLGPIVDRGLEPPCENADALRRWLAGNPASPFRGRAGELAAAAEHACIEKLFGAGSACLRATPCRQTCFADMRARDPNSFREADAQRLEAEARASPACRAPRPLPAPPLRRSDAWLRCERAVAPNWDPASPPGSRTDVPGRSEAEAAIPSCQVALAEAAGPDRATALFRLGRAQFYGGRRPDGRQTYGEALAAGSPAAAYALGVLVFYDQPPSRFREAAEFYEIAVRAGIAPAKAGLAGLLASGEGGVPADYSRAAVLAREAAEAGIGAGARVLGHLYQDGRGVRADHAEACRWLARGAELGDPLSRTDFNQLCRS